jgi:hypothetical protein
MRHFGKQPKRPYERKGYSAAIHQLKRNWKRKESLLRKAPPAAAQATAAAASEAQRVYRQALNAIHRDQWDELCASISSPSSEDLDLPTDQIRSKLLWSKVRQHQLIRTRTRVLTSGLRRPDGLPTATAQESVNLLAEQYRRQLSEHPRVPGASAYDTPSLQPAIEALREELGQPIPSGHTHIELLGAMPPATPLTVKRIIGQTPLHTAPGPDTITGPLLHAAARSGKFCEALTHLVNFCYAFHVWPTSWRQDLKLPLLKRGKDPSLPASYRPIALTNILARQVERLLRPILEAKVEPLLSRWQHGFRKKRSTQQCVYYLLQRIQDAVSRRTPRATAVPYPVVFLDIISAFDTVPHELLLVKLHRSGIQGDLLHFIRAFLSNRTFRVISSTAVSDATPATAGTPQGAVLSVLLFAFYINDMVPDDSSPQSRPASSFFSDVGQLLYADDVAAGPGNLHSIRLRAQQLQSYLNTIGAWASTWGVQFSPTKSSVVWFRLPATQGRKAADQRSRPLPAFTIPCGSNPSQTVRLPTVSQYQYLGVWLHETLSATPQFEHVRASATSASNMVRGMLSHSSPPSPLVVRRLCLSLVQTRIAYSLPFVNYSREQMNKLTKLVLQPMLSVCALPPTTHHLGACAYFGILPTQVLKDHSLLRLAASALATVQSQGRAPDLSRFPIASAIRNALAEDRLAEFGRAFSRASLHRYSDAAYSLRHSLSFPHIQLLRAVHHWRLQRHLPPDTDDLTVPAGWSVDTLVRASHQAASLQATALWLAECGGIRLSPSKLRYLQAHATRPTQPSRGALLMPLLGVNPNHPPSTLNVLSLPRTHADTRLAPFDALGQSPAPALATDPPFRTRLRSRLALNRASFAAIQNSRRPVQEQQCTRCVAPALETAQHVLLHCPRHEERREQLREGLRSTMDRIRSSLASSQFLHLRHFQYVTSSEHSLLYHLCLGSLPIHRILGNKLFATTQRLTGAFLEHIRLVRPV